MSLDRTLPENLDARADAFGRMLAAYHTALGCVEAARSHVRLWHGQPHPQAPDPTTLHALDVAWKMLQADLVYVERLTDSANRIADEANGGAS